MEGLLQKGALLPREWQQHLLGSANLLELGRVQARAQYWSLKLEAALESQICSSLKTSNLVGAKMFEFLHIRLSLDRVGGSFSKELIESWEMQP